MTRLVSVVLALCGVSVVQAQVTFSNVAGGGTVPGEVTAPTKVYLLFDTEDYTCDRSNDAIRDIANILSSEGVRGNFNVVGYLATRLVELRRQDVVDALRPHVIGTQTLYHSRHPDISELAEDPSYERSYRRTMAEEAKGVGMLEAVFGEGRCIFACPPGNSVSPASFDVYSDLGIVANLGTGTYGHKAADGSYSRSMLTRSDGKALGLWYFNQVQLPYYVSFTIQDSLFPGRYKDVEATLDQLAKWDGVVLYMHPHMAVKTVHWDQPNYRKGNLVEWRKWLSVPDREPAETAAYYANLRDFIRRLKADGRFEISDVEAYLKSLKPRRDIAAADLPAIRAALEKDFGCIRAPASWSVADAFQAAARLLRGEKSYHPGKVYGFLERPRGVTASVTLSAADLRAAARKLDLTGFLPSEIVVGDATIGPADFLLAALEVLTSGAETVTVEPREQLGSFGLIDGFERFSLAGTWLHTPDFRDRYVTERLRLQLWTMRVE